MSTPRSGSARPRRVIRWAALAVVGLVVTGCVTPSTSTMKTSDANSGSTPDTSLTPVISSAPAGAPTYDIAVVGPASSLLVSLTVKGRAPKTGYTRARFGDAWTDDVTVEGGHNGCDTRNDILRRDLVQVVLKANTRGCVAASGVLHDPYSGRTINFVRGANTSAQVQIDHVVALSDAWQTGAQSLSALDRRNFANDPLELLAVDGPTNQRKGDGDASTWLTPSKAERCAYIARQIAVKAKYHLWVTPAERTAMVNVLAVCPHQGLPGSVSIPGLLSRSR